MNSLAILPKGELNNELTAKKILVVEDDMHWQVLIGSTLRSVYPDVQIRYAKTVADAELFLSTGCSFNMIIADQQLKGKKTGIDLWRQCQSNENSQVPFMLVSGMSETSYHNVFIREEKCPIYMSKPFDLTLFKTIIDWQLVEYAGRKMNKPSGSRIFKTT